MGNVSDFNIFAWLFLAPAFHNVVHLYRGCKQGTQNIDKHDQDRDRQKS